MSGFSTLNQDWPILNLAVGLLLYSGCFAVGLLFVSHAGGRGDSQSVGQHWCRPMICVVTGVGLFCGVSNWLGWLQLANRLPLVLWLSLWLGIGLLNLTLAMRRFSFRARCWPDTSDLLIIVPSLLLLVSASASSTKIDELYYHMLAPARFVLEGQLDFHRYPWQSALPQMYFQIGMSPLHAVGTPHAGNVLSACIGIQLAVAIRSLLRSRMEDRFFASLIGGLVLTGTHASVLYTTSGAHAVGDASLATVILMLAYSASRREQISAWHAGLLLSTAASTKVSLLPVAGVMSLLFLFRIHRTAPRTRRQYLEFAVPGLLICVPSFFWTWIESGSPFGPLLAGRFGSSVYDVERIQEVLSSSRMKARQFDAMLI